ncbi:MAG: hypothetical protein EBT44_04990 [Actinobacteria bacterium]|uniref:Uncharacterized protein n=1 Tax=Candidatus Fonsibacter lacus TaxID=2576439 RepID=A0A965GDJ9_9PROT|nr:hypothetical protein [Candidatus Fonsibacter lacus]
MTTSKSGRVSASATITGSASGLETTTGIRDLAANLLTDAPLYPICAGGTSANEGIGNLNDRNSKTKYLCFNASNRLNATYIRNSAGFYTGNIGSKLVTGIQFTSGDSDRSRDPIIYSLFGCTSLNNGCSPIVVNGRTAIDVLRNDSSSTQSFLNTTPYNYYKVTFGALRTSWTDALQVAEVALIGTDANAGGLIPTFGAVTPVANGFTVQITNFNAAYTWRGSVNNNGGVSIGSDGLVTVTGLAGATTGTVAITTSRPKYESATASISGTSLNSALIPTFGAATPTADGFVVPISNYSSDYIWDANVITGSAAISGGVLTVTGQSAANQAVVTVTTTRNGYGTGRAQVVATALADGLTPNFGPSLGTTDGFTIQVRNYSNLYTWNISASAGQGAISSTGLITVTGLAAGASSTVTVSTSKSGSFTVISQAVGKAPIGTALTPRFTLSTSTSDGFTAQILNYDAAYTWSGTANTGSVTISETGLVTVTGAGIAVAPRTRSIVGEDIKLEVPISAATSSTDVTVVVDIPVDAAPSSTSFTGRAVATDAVDQGLRTIRLDGSSSGSTVTNVSAPIAITIPASAGIGVPVYSPDGTNWVELPLLAAASLPDGQEMGYYKYDDGTILILTRKIGG